MAAEAALLEAFELHDAGGIRRALAAGASPVEPIKGQPPIDALVQMYTRSPQFAACLRVLLEAGAAIEDQLLQAVLLDDDGAVRRLASGPGAIDRRLSCASAYTSCRGVSALHVCAEFNSVRCAAALLAAGLDVDDRADVDEDGCGTHTPIFHAVNSNQNYCRPVMELLVEAGASLDVRVARLMWGAGLDWETMIFDVTPVSYAQCGLYRQFHRREQDIYGNIAFMLRKQTGREPTLRNVPNRYVNA